MTDLDLLLRIRKATLVTGVPLAIVIAFHWGLYAGAAWAAGIAWSLVNLLFTTHLVKQVVTTGERPILRIVAIVLVKFPVLYAVGFLLLWNGRLPAAGLMAGFTWPFFVISMKGLGRYYLRLDDTGRISRRQTTAGLGGGAGAA
jgi:hypothetical protein